jgi:hypothetical protein
MVAEPMVIDSSPEVDGYRWNWKLNGGAVLKVGQNTFGVGGAALQLSKIPYPKYAAGVGGTYPKWNSGFPPKPAGLGKSL